MMKDSSSKLSDDELLENAEKSIRELFASIGEFSENMLSMFMNVLQGEDGYEELIKYIEECKLSDYEREKFRKISKATKRTIKDVGIGRKCYDCYKREVIGKTIGWY